MEAPNSDMCFQNFINYGCLMLFVDVFWSPETAHQFAMVSSSCLAFRPKQLCKENAAAAGSVQWMEVSACRVNVECFMGGICSKISGVEVYSVYLNISTLQLPPNSPTPYSI